MEPKNGNGPGNGGVSSIASDGNDSSGTGTGTGTGGRLGGRYSGIGTGNQRGGEERVRATGTPKTPDDKSVASFIGSRNSEPENKARIPSAPSTKQPKGKATSEDENDVVLLVQGTFGGLAALTRFKGWQFSDEEAEAVAAPAARILARHKPLQGAVREFADPAALILALGIPAFARWQMYKLYVQMNNEAIARGYTGPTSVPPQQSQQPDFVAPSNGPPIYRGLTPEMARISSL